MVEWVLGLVVMASLGMNLKMMVSMQTGREELLHVAHEASHGADRWQFLKKIDRRRSMFAQQHEPTFLDKLVYKTHVVAGTRVKVGVREVEHIVLIRDHLEREENVYELTAHAIQQSELPDNSTLVVDAGSNHGAVAAFAALHGASVEAVEMQEDLSKVVSENARANGVNVTVINAAIASSVGRVSYSGHDIAEGAIAQLAPPSEDAPTVASITLDDLIGPRHVAMLKIDVEGVDLVALTSADASFAAHRVDHSVVEFGPPSRWMSVTGQTAADGVRTMGRIRKHGYHVRLVRSYAWDTARGIFGEESGGEEVKRVRRENIEGNGMSHPTVRKATRFGLEYIELANEADDKQLVKAMETCNCESYLWFALV